MDWEDRYDDMRPGTRRMRLPTTAILDRTATQARLDFVAAEGRRWQKVNADAFAKLTPGTTVIIDIATGE
jgi:hypothetical protein